MTKRTASFIVLAAGLLSMPGPSRSARPQREPRRYGYLVQGGAPCAVWWAEGAYKVMRDDPVPAAEQGIVRISAARNEYEPFLVVLSPTTRLDGVRVSAARLAGEKGATIGAANVSICHVEYVKVTTPTDALGEGRLVAGSPAALRRPLHGGRGREPSALDHGPRPRGRRGRGSTEARSASRPKAGPAASRSS